MHKTAVISPCGQYRYQLERRWGSGPTVMWIMLNPSTADAYIDDRTIKRCIAFSQREGFAGMLVGNLWAYRATDPYALWDVDDARGPDNAEHLKQMGLRAQRVICAWGTHGTGHQFKALGIPTIAGGAFCLGRTKDGSPRHPLYLRADTALEPFQ